jgi:hypothetical protein
VHVRGTAAYLAYRNAGFRALDITNPTNPVEIMRFDNPMYQGQPDKLVGIWPHAPSGRIYAVYERSGFVVLQPTFDSAAYGVGTMGSNFLVPALTVAGPPYIGSASFALATGNGLPGAPAALLLGVNPTNVPVFGIILLVHPAGIFATVGYGLDGSGNGSLGLPLPNNVLILNASFFMQSVLLDAGLPSSLSSTQGIQIY